MKTKETKNKEPLLYIALLYYTLEKVSKTQNLARVKLTGLWVLNKNA